LCGSDLTQAVRELFDSRLADDMNLFNSDETKCFEIDNELGKEN
jgi:hypothetical protein